ncbi:kinesin light chain isoform 1, putative [Bodo saltans]|uniref:Kinesin light chain isoform 1, putative n=1 Tax=Bodo saltans TaxID=75058 RepID=A0A0S4JCS5_BODSA|nr:kinesin light chain isoform 1, putative [Bodo saltans]|eukprot:CUG89357.1 kinesin light chain isoform 1, putative [Bodo saltans]
MLTSRFYADVTTTTTTDESGTGFLITNVGPAQGAHNSHKTAREAVIIAGSGEFHHQQQQQLFGTTSEARSSSWMSNDGGAGGGGGGSLRHATQVTKSSDKENEDEAHHQHPNRFFAPAALHTTFSSVQEIESEGEDNDERHHHGGGSRGWSPARRSHGGESNSYDGMHYHHHHIDETDDHNQQRQTGTYRHDDAQQEQYDDDDDANCCQCVDVIGQLLRTGEYALCVEYAASFLENVQPGDVTLAQTQWVLCYLTKAYIRLSEIEHAKVVLSLWSELLDQSGGGGGGAAACFAMPVERHQWRVRLLLTTGDLCSANGEREEAMQALVLAWRVQAYLHGPESKKCLSTYVRIAEMKVQLAQDTDAFSMVRYAAAQLVGIDANLVPISNNNNNIGNDIGLWLLWSHVLRLQVVLAARQRRWNEAAELSYRSIAFLRHALLRWEAPPSMSPASGSAYKALRTALGQALMRTAEILHSSAADVTDALGNGNNDLQQQQQQAATKSPRSSKGESMLSMFAEGLQLISECFPPTSEEVVRAQLRLATLHSLREQQQHSRRHGGGGRRSGGGGGTASNTTLAPSYWEQSAQANAVKKNNNNRSHNNITTLYESQQGNDERISPALGTPAEAPPHASTTTSTARQLIQNVVSTLQQSDVRGGRHVHLLIEAFEALADLEHHMGDYRGAATSYHKAKAAAGQLFAPDHERCAILQHKLAESLLSAGHWEDAVSLLHELKEWCLLCPAGVRPPVPLVVLHHSLGSAMRLAERFDKAEGYYREALADEQIDFVREALADEQIDFVTKTRVLGNLAALFLTTGDIDAAIHYNQLALTTRMGKLGEQHQDVAASYANLAALYQRKCSPKQALFFSEKCLEIMNVVAATTVKRKHGQPHNNTSSNVKNSLQKPTRPSPGLQLSAAGSNHATGCGYSGVEMIDGVSSVRAWALRTLRTPAPSSS